VLGARLAGLSLVKFRLPLSGRFIGFFWSPVTGSKEQRSAKRRPHLEPPAPRGAPFSPAAAPPPSQQLTSQPWLAAAIPALP
jgi:hypothetical protein